MNIVALSIATLIPLLFLYSIYSKNLYKTGSFSYVLYCFFWGLAAYGLAYYVNTAISDLGLATWDNVVRFWAPIAEEILKALILIYLVRKRDFTYFVDGAIYGFAAGIGFAVIENYQYVLSSDAAMMLALSRVLSTNLIHAAASGMVGIALGLSRFQRILGKILLLIGGLLVGMALHVTFNNVASDMGGSALLLTAIGLGFGGVGVITLAIRRGLAEEKAWIEEKLGMADRVSSQEVKVVTRMEDLEEVLEPLAEIFGEEKAEDIEKFLVIQAKLGILRKTLDKLTDEKMKTSVENQMGDLRVEMEAARKSVGSWAMLYLRNIFPEDGSPLWNSLETAIQKKIEARPASGGMDVFGDLKKRTAEADAPRKSVFDNIKPDAKTGSDPEASE